MNNRFCVLLLVFALSASMATRAGANPWQKLLPFRKVEADPNKIYAVTDANGPWMILATAFRGDNADEQARKLVYELRKKFKLEAYMHATVFDYTQDVRGRGFNPDGSPKVMRHAHDDAVKEVAVLVGNFSSVDDDHATDALKKIKTIQPAALRTEQAKSGQVFADLRQAMNTKKKKGPMGNAFVVTNPLLPAEYFNSAGLDKLVLEMNEEVPHSLLTCPGKYSVKVATFTGTSVIDQRRIQDVSRGKDLNYTLEEAAENAHLLTETLRKEGWEAYEFHDRTQSIVTVGNFDIVTVPGPGGRPVPSGQVQQIVANFGLNLPSGPQIGTAAAVSGREVARRKQTFPTAWRHLDVNPMPIPVPRKALSSAYLR